jgi:hypothetical protein
VLPHSESFLGVARPLPGQDNEHMATQTEHSRLIAEAAREILRPLGVRQKGRSRSWIDDRAWWLGHVEFQPSSWSKGSYLNVGVMWLWHELPYLTYDVGYRVHDFEPYRNSQQFQEVAVTLARKAADEITKYRVTFASVDSAAVYFASLPDMASSSFLSAGIVFGLEGRANDARKWFDAYLALDDDRSFVSEEKQRIHELRDLLDDQPVFKRRIRESIARTRELQKLPPLVDWQF